MARLDMEYAENGQLAANALASEEMFFELGMQYSVGHSVPRDLVTAHKWFNLAAIRGNEAAKQYRKELASEMSKEEVAEALASARAYLETVH